MNKNKNKIADTESLAMMVNGLKRTPGHLKFGGRVKGSLNKRTRQAIEICEAMDFHPAALLATVVLTGKLPNPDGTTVEIDATGRMDALKALCPYVMPRLQATQVTGKDDGPVELARATTELERAMATPGGVEIIQRAALLIAGQPDTLPAPAPDDGAKPPARLCPGPDDEREREKEERGPWR
jgi:hypothetical protein